MMSARDRNHAIYFITKVPLILLILLTLCSGATAQDNDSFIPSDGSGGDAFQQALNRAEAVLDDGLTTMNESTIRNAANLYDQIIDNYSNDDRHFNAYFASAFIHIEYLQGISDIEHAQNLLNLLINNHPSAYSEVTDALITLAQVEYSVLGDYRSAQEHLSAILNSPMLSRQLEYRDVETKVLLAKCRQKLGEYERSYDLWQEITLTSEAYDTEGRLQWHENLDKWQVVDDGLVRLYFESGTPWENVLSSVRDGLAVASQTWGIYNQKPVYVFLYSSSDSLFDYTLKYDGFALTTDSEIHLSSRDLDRLDHLTGWLIGSEVNSRANESTLPLLRAGFNHYFMGSREEIDYVAAKEIYFYGDLLSDDYLLFPMSFDYTFSEEYAGISSSFLHYLIDDGNVSVSKLKEFHRLLMDNPTARLLPPRMAELLQYTDQLKIVGRQGSLISPAQLYDLFDTKLGMELGEALSGWRESLQPEIAEVETEFESLTGEIERVDVDLTTPDNALRTYWDAYIHGDIDTLIRASTHEPADFLRDAKELYEQQGILESVMLETFIMPNRGAVMRVIFDDAIADDRHVFQVRIERSNGSEDRTFLVRKEDGEWKVDTN